MRAWVTVVVGAAYTLAVAALTIGIVSLSMAMHGVMHGCG